MRFDLHVHSCLSPCANLEMSPAEIVARARAAGLDGLALTDIVYAALPKRVNDPETCGDRPVVTWDAEGYAVTRF